MDKPKVASSRPQVVALTAGREYWWCACGHSAEQPFCDGSHAGTSMEPLGFKAEKTGDAWICQCKLTKTPPYCDGSHKQLQKT